MIVAAVKSRVYGSANVANVMLQSQLLNICDLGSFAARKAGTGDRGDPKPKHSADIWHFEDGTVRRL